MKPISMFLALTAMLCLFATSGCKVGEDDPGFSLLSRNARITGIWTLSNLDGTTISSSTSGNTVVTNTTTRRFTGFTMNVTGGFGGGTTTYSYSEQMEINEDGTYRITTISDGAQEILEGYWWWLKDTKDKARIAFDDDLNSVDILQLKNNEVVFVTHRYYRDVDNSGDFDEVTEDMTATYSKE